MSIVCDCSGDEKAYLIINPDSVDRQEILSLNPPICYEIKQTLFIDGEPFIAEQPLAPDNPYIVGPYEEEGTNAGWIKWENYYFGYSSGYIFRPYNINVYESGRYRIYGFGVAYYSRGRLICRLYSTGRELTNSGRSYVIQPADVTPDCTSDKCSLTINYLDGSTFNYGEVPCDVTVTQTNKLEISDNSGILKTIDLYGGEPLAFQCGERECPPETCCNPCEGSALNCCYDDAGRLIDSFVRRV